MRTKPKSDKFFLFFIVLLALAYRLDYLFASHFVIDSDEAIVGLMAKHINQGQGIPVFYYGQNYMGSFEAIVAALAFRVFGMSSVVLKCVPLAFSLILIIVLYKILRELKCSLGARIGILLAALPPAALLEWGTRARGGFIEVVLIGALASLSTLRFLGNERDSRLGIFWIGLLLGFGWWVNNQIIYFILPIGYVILARYIREQRIRSRTLGSLVCGLVGFILGGLPFWAYNINHHFISFEMFGSANGSDIWDHIGGLFSQALPILLGAKRFWQNSEYLPGISYVVWFSYLFILLFYIILRGRELVSLLWFKIDTKTPLEFFFLLLLTALLVFALSSFGYLVQAPRYLLPIYVSVFVLLGWSLEMLWKNNRFLGRLFTFTLVAINLCSFYWGGRAIPGEPHIFKGERVSKDQSELIAWLKANNYPWVRTNYWIGYRLAFETGEAIRFLVTKEPYQHRIDSYLDQGEQYQGDIPLVLVPAQAKLVEDALHELGFNFQRRELSGYVVLYALLPKQTNLTKIPSSELEVVSQYAQGSAGNAVDGDLHTRWGSAHPQTQGMQFEVDFKSPHKLRALAYELGDWIQDYPRGLVIRLELSSGEVKDLFNPDKYEAIRYHISSDPKVYFYFEPLEVKKVILIETGSHPVFDWSIAELEFFE